MYAKRYADCILHDGNGRVLLQHRTDDAPTFPGLWCLFGGGIEENESPEASVRRELREELQLELMDPELFKRYDAHHQYGLIEKFVFVELVRQDVETLRKQQMEGRGWILFPWKSWSRVPSSRTMS